LATSNESATGSARSALLQLAHTVAGWLWVNVLVGLFGLWLAGWLFRDRNHLTALCLAIPTVAVSLALAATAFLAWVMRCRRVALAAALCTVLPTLSLLYSENQWRRPAPQGDVARSLRVVHWNVGEVDGGAKTILERLAPLNADVYVLAEFFGLEAQRAVLKGLGKPFRILREQHYLTVFARGPMRLVHLEKRISKRAYFAQWKSPAGPLLFLLIDLKSRPLFYRGATLDLIAERMVELKPDLIIGDFNTSRRARVLADLPDGYVHAYDAAGAGWSYTWHDAYPVWDIDQCIAGPRIEPIRYDTVATGVSDHRLQVFDFSVAEPQGE